MPPNKTPSTPGTTSSAGSKKPTTTSRASTQNSRSKSSESASGNGATKKTNPTATASPPPSAPSASNSSKGPTGPWIEALPAMIATLRTDIPLESLPELRSDLVSMALLADHYTRLIEIVDESTTHWGECDDPASQQGTHQRTSVCIFCGGRP